MKVERLYAITVYLLNHGLTSANELAKHFEVSLRTIQRDIDSLCIAGIPVVSVAGANCGYEIAEKYKSNDRMKEICERTAARLVPSWIECDKENKKATITELPKREQIEDIPVNETLIVELYSK